MFIPKSKNTFESEINNLKILLIMKSINRSNKTLDENSKYFKKAIQYNKGVAEDARYFNLITPELSFFSKLTSRLKS